MSGVYDFPGILPEARVREIVREELAAQQAELHHELAAPASAWNELAESTGDYSVADAAKTIAAVLGVPLDRLVGDAVQAAS